MFGIYTHGETRVRKISVNHGKEQYERREKFCSRHGWIDLFATGGDLAWIRAHKDCDTTEYSGASVKLKLRTFKKAA